LFAALNTAQADAFIACWDAKFAYWSLRPVTAIRQLVDPSWTSYITTPPFPSYVSGHSTTSAAAATVLSAVFPGNADELAAMAEEAAASRLYGGIHFRSDNEVGLEMGRRVGATAVRAYSLGG
jgi:membrane-associated phospholipid phosphatase